MWRRTFRSLALALSLTASLARAQTLWPESCDFVDTKSYRGAPGTIHGKNIYYEPTIPKPLKELDRNCSISLGELFSPKGLEFCWDLHTYWFHKGFKKPPPILGPEPWDQKADWAEGSKMIDQMSAAEKAAKDPTHNPHATHARVEAKGKKAAETAIAERWVSGVHGTAYDGIDPKRSFEIMFFAKDPDDTLFRHGISTAVRIDDTGQVVKDGLFTGISKQAHEFEDIPHATTKIDVSKRQWQFYKFLQEKMGWLFPSPAGHNAANLAAFIGTGIPVPPPLAWSGTGIAEWLALLNKMKVKRVGPIRAKGPHPGDFRDVAESGVPIMTDVIVMGIGATVGATILSQWIGMLQVRLETGTIDRIQPPDDLRANAGRASVPTQPVPVLRVRYIPAENFSLRDKQRLFYAPNAPYASYSPAFGRPNPQ